MEVEAAPTRPHPETQRQGQAARRPSTVPLRQLLPLPQGADRLTVELDGTLVYNSGDCSAVIGVDLVTLDALAPDDQDFVCAAFTRLATSLAAGQRLQLLVESHPLDPAAAVGMARGFITTAHPVLAELAQYSLEHLRQEMQRKYVPDKRGYVLIGPAPEAALGLAGVMQGVTEAVGVSRGRREPDRYGLDAAVDDVLSICKEMGLGAERLRGRAVASLLWRCAHPGDDEPADLLAAPNLLDLLAPTTWREGFTDLQVGGVYTRSLYVLEPTDLTSPGWLDDLVSLDATMRLSWHVTGRDRDAERTRQLRRRTGFLTAAQARRLSDPDTEDAAVEAARLAEELLDPSAGIVATTLVLTLQAPDRATLDAATRRAKRVLRTRLAVPFGLGRGYQRRLWQSSLPFGVDVSRRQRRWHTYSVGNGLPYLAHSPGTRRGLPIGYTTQGGELVPLNLSDASLPTWAVVVTGRAGSGKTFLTQLFALHTLYEGGRATIIDRAGHYRTLIDLAGGVYIGLGKEAEPRGINLWALRPGESLKAKIQMVHAAHEIMLCHPGERLDRRVDAALERAIRQVYAAYQAEVDVGARDAAAYPLERDLVVCLDEMSQAADLTDAERDLYRLIRDSLHSYVGEGRYAHLVDRPTTVDLETRLLCWDVDGMDESQQPLLMYIIGYAMAQRAQNTYMRRHGAGRSARPPELLVIDEGWYIAKYSGAGRWLEDTARRTRHMGLRFVFTTQQLSDLINHPSAVAVFNAASLKCLFRQNDAQSASGLGVIEWLASRLQISLSEAKRLTQLGNGQMMLVREGKDGSYKRGLVDVQADDAAYWIFTSEPDYDVPAKLQAIEDAGGDTLQAIKTLVASGKRR